MGEELPLLPETQPNDDEDVVWGLQTATALWARGERREALVWVRRAAEAAGAAGDDMRAVELAKRGVSMEEYILAIEAAPPPSALQPAGVAHVAKPAVPLISFPDPSEPRTPPMPAAAPTLPTAPQAAPTQPLPPPTAAAGEAFDISDEPTSDYLGELDPIADRASMPLLLEEEPSHDGDELTVPRIDIAKMQKALDARGPQSVGPKSSAIVPPAAHGASAAPPPTPSSTGFSGPSSTTQPMVDPAKPEAQGPLSERGQQGPSSRSATKGPPPPPRGRTPTLQPGPSSSATPFPSTAASAPTATATSGSLNAALGASSAPTMTTAPTLPNPSAATQATPAPPAVGPAPGQTQTAAAVAAPSGGSSQAADLRATQAPRKKARAPILDPWADDFPIDDPPYHSRAASHHALEAGPMSEDDVVTSAAALETTLRRKPPPPPAIRPRAPAPGTVLADAPPNSTPEPLSRPNGDGQTGHRPPPPPPPMRRSATLTGAPNPLTTPPAPIVTDRKSAPPPAPNPSVPPSRGPASQAPAKHRSEPPPPPSVAQPPPVAPPAATTPAASVPPAAAQPTSPVPPPVADAPATPEPAPSPTTSVPAQAAPATDASPAPPPASTGSPPAAESDAARPPEAPARAETPAPAGAKSVPPAEAHLTGFAAAPRQRAKTTPPVSVPPRVEPKSIPDTEATSSRTSASAAPRPRTAPPTPAGMTPLFGDAPLTLEGLGEQAGLAPWPEPSPPPTSAREKSTPPNTRSAPPGSIPPAERSVAGLTLDRVDAFADLPGELQKHLASTARLIDLGESEEVKSFGTLIVVSGVVDVAATIADIAAGMVVEGGLITERTSITDVVPIRVVAPTKAKVAVWTREATEEALRTCPWVLEELVRVGDRFAALVGATMGPLGDLDDESRRQTLDRFRLRLLRPNETLAEKGADNPGLVVVGGGTLLVGDDGGTTETLSSGDLLFPHTVLDGSPSPHRVRASEGGALLLVAPRSTTVELFSTLPMLLELLRVA